MATGFADGMLEVRLCSASLRPVLVEMGPSAYQASKSSRRAPGSETVYTEGVRLLFAAAPSGGVEVPP